MAYNPRMVEAPSTPERKQEEPPAMKALAQLMRESRYTRADKTSADTTIESEGKRFSIEMVPDGKAEVLSDVQKLFIDTFGTEEVDPEEVLRTAVDGTTFWGSTDATKYRVHVVRDSAGEVVSTITGGRLQMVDAEGKSLGKQMFMVAYGVTAEKARQQGLAREAYISAIMQAAKDAHAEGQRLTLAVGECVYTSEDFWNKVGMRRVYGEKASKPGAYEELRYVQPALDFDLATGQVAEGAGVAPEHLMIHNFDDKNPSQEDVLAAVRAVYTWNNTWPREAFENDQALATHQGHVQPIWQEFKQQVQGVDRLVYLDKKSREEMERAGINIENHSAADNGDTGPEDF